MSLLVLSFIFIQPLFALEAIGSQTNPQAVPVAQQAGQPNRNHCEWWSQITQPQATVIAGACTLIAGVVAAFVVAFGWIVVHRTTLTREREARAEAARIAREDRLRAFECFLVEREQITEATPPTPPEHVMSAYYARDGILSSSAFRKEAAAVRRDILREHRDEFNRLDESLSRLPPQLLASDNQRTSRDKLADAIRALLQFVRNA